MTTPDTPAVTERLRERLIQRAESNITQFPDTHTAKSIVNDCWPIIETELQKRDRLLDQINDSYVRTETTLNEATEEKARLVGEFRRLAAKARSISEAAPQNGPDSWRQTAYIWEQAAQMLEESKP
jgi:hypothetical protein